MVKKLIQCVPNFSEGKDLNKIEKILDVFRGKANIKLLDYSSDKDYNRTVVTVVGEPQAIKSSIIQSVLVASEIIDMRVHKGQHPRIGAVDVIPFIPIQNITMKEIIELSKEVAKEISDKFNISVYLYEKSAVSIERENLAIIRKGEYEGLKEKLKKLKPDFGPCELNEKFGATAVGARMPLVAFNVNLDTSNIEIAKEIAKKVRFIGGGLRYCKAMGVNIEEKNITQVSMNMTDFTKTSLYRSFEMVKMEARRYGVAVIGSEIIGLVPLGAIIDTASYYMGFKDFSEKQILECNLME